MHIQDFEFYETFAFFDSRLLRSPLGKKQERMFISPIPLNLQFKVGTLSDTISPYQAMVVKLYPVAKQWSA